MNVRSPLSDSQTALADGAPDSTPSIGTFADDTARWNWLIETLGEAFCRKLGIFRVPDDLVLSVVIPVYNEKATIHEILRRVRAVPIRKEIIVVDDCSTDGTREILREMEQRDGDLKVVFHERNQGKGAALRTGFRHATGQIVIVQDADLEYDPAQYPSSSSRSSRIRPTSSSARGSSARSTASSTSGIPWRTRASRSCPTCSPT